MIVNPAPEPPASRSWLGQHWGLLVVLAAILFIAAVRIRLRDCPLERDEGEYAYAGQLMLQGIPPYQLAYNMKFPGTYAAYALIMAVFGQTPAGIHLGVMCVTSLTALMMYWLGRRMLDEPAGAAAGSSCVFLSASPSMLGLAGHATHFAGFCVAAGLCLLWPAWKDRRPWPALAAGALFGMAVLMKQHAIFIFLWAVLVLAMAGLRQPQSSLFKKWQLPAAAVLGGALVFGLMCLLLWHAGVFGKFWFWTIDYARTYVAAIPWDKAWLLFRYGFLSAIVRCRVFWLLAAAGLILLWGDGRTTGFRAALVGFCVASFLTTCPGFYFRFHYFLLMIPAISLLVGCAISCPGQLPYLRKHPVWQNAVPGLVCALALIGNALQNSDAWFTLSPGQLIRGMYGPELFTELQPVADYIRTNSTPADRVAVLGSEPEVYFLSQRHSATGYIYVYPLFEHHPYAATMQQDMIRDVETNRPKFVVFMRVSRSWGMTDENQDQYRSFLDWWNGSYQTNYFLMGMAEMDASATSHYFWGPDAVRESSNPQVLAALLFQRRETP